MEHCSAPPQISRANSICLPGKQAAATSSSAAATSDAELQYERLLEPPREKRVPAHAL
jgi:hypothetical protein